MDELHRTTEQSALGVHRVGPHLDGEQGGLPVGGEPAAQRHAESDLDRLGRSGIGAKCQACQRQSRQDRNANAPPGGGCECGHASPPGFCMLSIVVVPPLNAEPAADHGIVGQRIENMRVMAPGRERIDLGAGVMRVHILTRRRWDDRIVGAIDHNDAVVVDRQRRTGFRGDHAEKNAHANSRRSAVPPACRSECA